MKWLLMTIAYSYPVGYPISDSARITSVDYIKSFKTKDACVAAGEAIKGPLVGITGPDGKIVHDMSPIRYRCIEERL